MLALERNLKHMKLKIWTILSVCVLLLLSRNFVYAQEVSASLVFMPEDPQAERENGQVLDGFYDEQIEASDYGIALLSLPYGYAHNSKFDNYTVLNGIDVSYYQSNIDWNAVKADGIDFAIIRVGYRGYGDSGNLREDAKYAQNIQGALNAGLKVGVYIFSQATTTAEAIEEADFVLSRISGYNITFPVVMDFEYASVKGGEGGRLYNAGLSKRAATEVCKAFCQRVTSAGYRPMVYANKSMLNSAVYADEISASYDIWLANYTYETAYSGDYTCWQYTSSGSVNGISGRVDMNFWYEEPTTMYNGVDYSAVYDYEYYMNAYSDLASAYSNNSAGALAHFVNYGMSEGRQACADFSVNAYKNRYVDLRNAFGTDLKKYYMHYINSGKQEGRIAIGNQTLSGSVTIYNGKDYSDIFDYDFYVGKYSDLKKVYDGDDIGALQHFVNVGMSEGRQACADFNVYTYINRYADLRRVYGSDLTKYYMHYMNVGKSEGRSGAGTAVLVGTAVYNGVDYSAVYNYQYYISTNSDIKKAYGDDDEAVLRHFVNTGMAEGRVGNATFNVRAYKSRYTDLQELFGDDWKSYYMHYLNAGKTEGRNGGTYSADDYVAIYDFETYMEMNADLQMVYNNNPDAALEHFVEHGMSEGRQACNEFNVYTYKNRYADLQNAFGNDLTKYYMHYNNVGKAEGRSASIEENIESGLEVLLVDEQDIETELESEVDTESEAEMEVETKVE